MAQLLNIEENCLVYRQTLDSRGVCIVTKKTYTEVEAMAKKLGRTLTEEMEGSDITMKMRFFITPLFTEEELDELEL